MPSSKYGLIEQAMRMRKPVSCMYKGFRREVCPIILGHTKGEERALTYQFAGGSSSGLPPGGQWRCLSLSDVENVELRDGPWVSGARHTQQSACVEEVDLDVNPDSPYRPKRKIK